MPICPACQTVNNEIVSHCIECGESLENLMGMREEERKRVYIERGKTEIRQKPLSISHSIGYWMLNIMLIFFGQIFFLIMIYIPATKLSSLFFILSIWILFITPIPLLIILFIKRERKMYGISEEAKWRRDREGRFSIRFTYSRERIKEHFAAYIHLIITGIIYVAFAVFSLILIQFFSLIE